MEEKGAKARVGGLFGPTKLKTYYFKLIYPFKYSWKIFWEK